MAEGAGVVARDVAMGARTGLDARTPRAPLRAPGASRVGARFWSAHPPDGCGPLAGPTPAWSVLRRVRARRCRPWQGPVPRALSGPAVPLPAVRSTSSWEVDPASADLAVRLSEENRPGGRGARTTSRSSVRLHGRAASRRAIVAPGQRCPIRWERLATPSPGGWDPRRGTSTPTAPGRPDRRRGSGPHGPPPHVRTPCPGVRPVGRDLAVLVPNRSEDTTDARGACPAGSGKSQGIPMTSSGNPQGVVGTRTPDASRAHGRGSDRSRSRRAQVRRRARGCRQTRR